jgi:hypothetical protein
MKTSMVGLMVLVAMGGCSSGGDDGGGSSASGCAHLCIHTDTATSSQVNCVATQAVAEGYNWPADPVCSSIANESQCNTCTVNLKMSDADCSAIEQSCF